MTYTVIMETATFTATITCDRLPVPSDLISVTDTTGKTAIYTVVTVMHMATMGRGTEPGSIVGQINTVKLRCHPYQGNIT